MNELRWIILGIGIIIIVAIYVRESWKRRSNLLSRVDTYTPAKDKPVESIRINPGKEKNIDLSSAAAAFNSYLKKFRKQDIENNLPDSLPQNDIKNNNGFDNQEQESLEKIDSGSKCEETIIVIYLVSKDDRRFTGTEIRNAMETNDLEYGEMNIYHYHGEGDEFSHRALFSVADIHEPGTFTPDNISGMSTDGLALFMCLPAPIGGDIAFEIFLDCAQKLASTLGGELRNKKHRPLDTVDMDKLRKIANEY